MSDVVMRATDVHKRFGRLEVLKGISLEVRKGETVCIIGPSGSGKTTFIRCINHLEKIDAGRLSVDGELVGYRQQGDKLYELREREVARRRADIGMVFQHFNLFPHMSALENCMEAPVYVLGPSSAISSRVVREIEQAGGPVRRVSGEDPVANAIALARYADGEFGWNVNDPGHGFVVARSDEPLDAAAAAALSASGTWGPLLLTDSADTLPAALRGYLLDVKPGYTSDPTRAFYNHVWVIGDQGAISVNEQAEIDELAALAKIGGEE